MKRGRDDLNDDQEEEVNDAVEFLQASLERGIDHKLKALSRLCSLFDPNDDLYTNQKTAIDLDAHFYIVELLNDSSPAVRIKAADTIKHLASHSSVTMTRLTAAGLESNLTKLLFNPCADPIIDKGAIPPLVSMLLLSSSSSSPDPSFQDAASDALSSLTSFNSNGKLLLLEQLTQNCSFQALQHIEALIDSGMDCKSEDVGELLSRTVQCTILTLHSQHMYCGAGLAMLSTLCENKTDMVDEYIKQGAFPLIIDLIITPGGNNNNKEGIGGGSGNGSGSGVILLQRGVAVRDAAVRALWAVSDNGTTLNTLLSSLQGKYSNFTIDRVALALEEHITMAEREEEEREKQEEEGEQEGDVGGGGGGGDQEVVYADICFADEAKSLLHLLKDYRAVNNNNNNNNNDKGEGDEKVGGFVLVAKKDSCVVS